jgi:hypothetical protein
MNRPLKNSLKSLNSSILSEKVLLSGKVLLPPAGRVRRGGRKVGNHRKLQLVLVSHSELMSKSWYGTRPATYRPPRSPVPPDHLCGKLWP